jgi:hypothetical protein
VKRSVKNSPINGEAKRPVIPVRCSPFHVTVLAPNAAKTPMRIDKGTNDERLAITNNL